ncbi:MAG TPA: flagellar basal body P-ring formation chaperone FlgA [Methylococcaceae bacterium]|nr:flagellar basal body P-ring formation chaperone FlgA [Methylococcaceae bacterium]
MPHPSHLLFRAAAALSLSFAAFAAPPARENQPHETILDTARAFLESGARHENGETVIDVAPIDPRLQLAACDAPLEALGHSDTPHSGSATVGVRCAGSNPWTVYVRATVHLFLDVAVLRNARAKDAIVGEADLDFVRKDAAGLRGGYLSDPAQIMGRQLKRALPAGTVLTPDVLTAPRIVRRGQQVVIRSSGAALSVQMSGEALEDGEDGQRIHVRNSQSRRIVEGRVVAPGVVEIGR